jgi:hypothetical protein
MVQYSSTVSLEQFVKIDRNTYKNGYVDKNKCIIYWEEKLEKIDKELAQLCAIYFQNM